MHADPSTLLALLQEIPDPRDPRGRRHPLPAILSLLCLGFLCGLKTYGAIADWGRQQGRSLAHLLGFTRETSPCAGTFYYLLRNLD